MRSLYFTSHAKANRNKFLLVKVATTTEDPNDYPELLSMTTEHEKQIKRDIARTFPDHDLFKSKEGLGQETLYNVSTMLFLFQWTETYKIHTHTHIYILVCIQNSIGIFRNF